MDTNIDSLKIKIDEARANLTDETKKAIDAIDWKKVILDMRVEKGYSFEQLEDLETETELLLCGLIDPENYPKELEKRMGIPKPQVDLLVNEMNEKIFKKIREELVKNIDRSKSITNDELRITNEKETEEFEDRDELLRAIENTPISEKVENITLTNDELNAQKELSTPIKIEEKKEIKITTPTPSILEQKLSGSFQSKKIETDHSVPNITKPGIDPYRESIE